jgi:putative ABC transport system ATP-binding protein
MTYAYRTGKPVLHDIDVTVPATSIAIVGETGSGKSTFAKLLTRLATPPTADRGGRRPAGSIRRPGRSRSAWCPRTGFLFDWTVRENVSRPRRRHRPRGRRRLRRAGLGDWVRALQDGLDTRAGNGVNSSVGSGGDRAGSRQIADPGLLILTRRRARWTRHRGSITEALRRLSAGRTTVTIAHRLSTAEHADRVLVFDSGRIVEAPTTNCRRARVASCSRAGCNTRSTPDDAQPVQPDPSASIEGDAAVKDAEEEVAALHALPNRPPAQVSRAGTAPC